MTGSRDVLEPFPGHPPAVKTVGDALEHVDSLLESLLADGVGVVVADLILWARR
jgi:hypothetical protein